MRILLVAATSLEVAPVTGSLRHCGDVRARTAAYAHGDRHVDVLVTGVGMIATAVWCSRALLSAPYDVALNAGVCGSFTPRLPPGTVVHVVHDSLPELGAEDGDRFLTPGELGLVGDNEFPLTGGALVNTQPPPNAAIAALPQARGITVNTVHGRDDTIAAVAARFNPDVESMEGAAFMYACLAHGVPFAQVRAVSNVVERRNRDAWKMREAIEALGATMRQIVQTL